MIDIKAIRDRAESIRYLSVMVMNKHEVYALCDEIERLRADAAAYHALRTELDKQMGAKQ